MNSAQLPANSHVDILSTWEVHSQFEVRLEQLYLGPFIYVLLPYIRRNEAPARDPTRISHSFTQGQEKNHGTKLPQQPQNNPTQEEPPSSHLNDDATLANNTHNFADNTSNNELLSSAATNQQTSYYSAEKKTNNSNLNNQKTSPNIEKCILGFRVVGRLSTNRRAIYDPVFSELGYLDFSAATATHSQNSPYVAYFSSTLSFPCSISDLTLLSQLELSLFCVDIGFFFGHITLNLFGSNGILRQGRCLIPFNVYPSLELVPPSLGCGDVFYNTCVKCEHSFRGGASNDDFLFHPTLNIFEDETTSSSLFSTNSALSSVSSSSSLESENDSDENKPALSNNILHLFYRKSFFKLRAKHAQKRKPHKNRVPRKIPDLDNEKKNSNNNPGFFLLQQKRHTKTPISCQAGGSSRVVSDGPEKTRTLQDCFTNQKTREHKKKDIFMDSKSAANIVTSPFTHKQTGQPEHNISLKNLNNEKKKKKTNRRPPLSTLSKENVTEKTEESSLFAKLTTMPSQNEISESNNNNSCGSNHNNNSSSNSNTNDNVNSNENSTVNNSSSISSSNGSNRSSIYNNDTKPRVAKVGLKTFNNQKRTSAETSATARILEKKRKMKLCRQFVEYLSDNEDCVLVSGPSLIPSWSTSSSTLVTGTDDDDSSENHANSDYQYFTKGSNHKNNLHRQSFKMTDNKTYRREFGSEIRAEDEKEEEEQQYKLETNGNSRQDAVLPSNQNGQFVLVCPNWNDSNVRDEQLRKCLSRLKNKSKHSGNGGNQSDACCDSADSLFSDTNVSCATPPLKSDLTSNSMATEAHDEHNSDNLSVVGLSDIASIMKKKKKGKINIKKKKFAIGSYSSRMKGFSSADNRSSPKQQHHGWVHLRTHGSLRRSTFRAINCYKLLDLYDRGALPLCASQSSDDHARSCLQKMCEKHLMIALERFGFFSLSLPAFPVPVLYALQPHRSTVPQRPLFGSSICHQSNQYGLRAPYPLTQSMNTDPIFFGPDGNVQQTHNGSSAGSSLIMYRQLYHDDALGWECRSRLVHTVKSIVQEQQMHQVVLNTEFTPTAEHGYTMGKSASRSVRQKQSPVEECRIPVVSENGRSLEAQSSGNPVVSYVPGLPTDTNSVESHASKCEMETKSEALTTDNLIIDNEPLTQEKINLYNKLESCMKGQQDGVNVFNPCLNNVSAVGGKENENKIDLNKLEQNVLVPACFERQQKDLEDNSLYQNTFNLLFSEKKKCARFSTSDLASFSSSSFQQSGVSVVLEPTILNEANNLSSNSLKSSVLVSTPLDKLRSSKGLSLPVGTTAYQSERVSKPLFTDNKEQRHEVCESNANIIREMWSRFGLLQPHFMDCTNLSQQQHVYHFQQLLQSSMQKEQEHQYHHQLDDSVFTSDSTSFDRRSSEFYNNSYPNLDEETVSWKTSNLQKELNNDEFERSARIKVSTDLTTSHDVYKAVANQNKSVHTQFALETENDENTNGMSLISCYHSALSETQAALSLVSRPMSIPLTYENKYLLWKNRELLRRRGIGLLKLVTAADLALPSSKLPQALSELVSCWPCPTIEGALELLSPLSQSPHVRQLAINSLNAVNDSKLCRFLPQLIQAIRYDTSGPQSKLLDLLIDRASRSPLIASRLHWGLSCESEDTEEGHLFIRGHQRLMDVLSNSYTTSKCNNGWRVIELQKKLIRQLRYISAQVRERRDRADQKTQRLRLLLRAAGKTHHRLNPRQQSPEQRVMAAATGSADVSVSSRNESVQNMNTTGDVSSGGPILSSGLGFSSPGGGASTFVSSESSGQAQSLASPLIPDELNLLDLEIPIPLPIEPHYLLVGVIPEESFVVRSSQYPLVIACKVLVPKKKNISKSVKSSSSSSFNSSNVEFLHSDDENSVNMDAYNHENIAFWWGKTKEELLALDSFEEEVKKYLFKAGDDLRQDQLVTQLVGIINELLIGYGCDYCLTVYHVVSLSRRDGLIEFIDRSGSLSSVRKAYPTLRQYFAFYYPSPNTHLGFPAEILDRFIKSCSAFSVITFLLGVGDRHLDNLMVSEDGRLFHVDFGFILGEDPKPFPPPMKLCSEIIETLGGLGSEGYMEFQNRCCQCFRCLRRHSNLLIDILLLMANSGIRSLRTDPFSVISRVQEKFQLDTTEAAAEAYLLDIVGISANALFPAVVDKFHEWTVYWK